MHPVSDQPDDIFSKCIRRNVKKCLFALVALLLVSSWRLYEVQPGSEDSSYINKKDELSIASSNVIYDHSPTVSRLVFMERKFISSFIGSLDG